MAKVVAAMSGGVDSSVTAALLKEKGYEVSGVTMKIWDGEALPREGMRHGCYGPEEEGDIEDARKVSQILGIDFYVFDLRQEYKAEVLDYFCHEYLFPPEILLGILVEGFLAARGTKVIGLPHVL